MSNHDALSATRSVFLTKILVLDIETKPALAYVWRAFDENIGYEQVVEPGGMICWAAKWVGKKEVLFYSEWEHGRDQMVRALHQALEDADAVVTYNGDKFDLPKVHGEFILAGLVPPAPITSIDVLKSIKKLGFLMNRLAFIGPLLNAGNKMKHEGFDLWRKVMEGDVKAQAKMRRYNIKDVRVLETLYQKVKPFIKNHPHMGDKKHECGACGSNHVQLRGFRRTKFFRIQRIQCQACGSWSEGSRTKVT
jgi:hypothetical protein